jgi:hypothetical protein
VIGDLEIRLKFALLINSHTYKQEKAEGKIPSAMPEKSGDQLGELI